MRKRREFCVFSAVSKVFGLETMERVKTYRPEKRKLLPRMVGRKIGHATEKLLLSL